MRAAHRRQFSTRLHTVERPRWDAPRAAFLYPGSMDSADRLRAYIAQRPLMFLRIDLHVRETDYAAEVRAGYREGPAPVWGGQGETADLAIERAAGAALDYWGWRQSVGHV